MIELIGASYCDPGQSASAGSSGGVAETSPLADAKTSMDFAKHGGAATEHWARAQSTGRQAHKTIAIHLIRAMNSILVEICRSFMS
ncbi:MAG: hypothetical protein R3B49_03690 [Phycisphaerales bacterium]